MPLSGPACFFHGVFIVADLLLFLALNSYVTLFMGARKAVFILKVLAIIFLVIILLTVILSWKM